MSRRRLKHYQWMLSLTGSCVLDATGRGQFQLEPGGARERWIVALINTNVQTDSLLIATLRVYRGSPVPTNLLGGTYTANLDSNSTDRWVLNMNEGLVFVYEGGAEGDVATAHIEGVRHVWDWG